MLMSSESRSLWPLGTYYGRLLCRLQMMAVPICYSADGMPRRSSERRSPPKSVATRFAVDRLSPNSVEIGRQGRVATVGKHASDLLRQDAF